MSNATTINQVQPQIFNPVNFNADQNNTNQQKVSNPNINPALAGSAPTSIDNLNGVLLANAAPTKPAPTISKDKPYNLIQVTDGNQGVNAKLKAAYQEKYAKPIKEVAKRAKASANMQTGGAIAGSATASGTSLLTNNPIYRRIVAPLMQIGKVFAAQNTATEVNKVVTQATNDYLAEANQILKANGYPTVNRF